jgi:hypothetical protein
VLSPDSTLLDLALADEREFDIFFTAFLARERERRALEATSKPPRRQRQPRDQERAKHKPTLASVAKQASKAGIEVARYELKPDGTVVIVTGTPEPPTESNPWLAGIDDKVTKQ